MNKYLPEPCERIDENVKFTFNPLNYAIKADL